MKSKNYQIYYDFLGVELGSDMDNTFSISNKHNLEPFLVKDQDFICNSAINKDSEYFKYYISSKTLLNSNTLYSNLLQKRDIQTYLKMYPVEDYALLKDVELDTSKSQLLNIKTPNNINSNFWILDYDKYKKNVNFEHIKHHYRMSLINSWNFLNPELEYTEHYYQFNFYATNKGILINNDLRFKKVVKDEEYSEISNKMKYQNVYYFDNQNDYTKLINNTFFNKPNDNSYPILTLRFPYQMLKNIDENELDIFFNNIKSQLIDALQAYKECDFKKDIQDKIEDIISTINELNEKYQIKNNDKKRKI